MSKPLESLTESKLTDVRLKIHEVSDYTTMIYNTYKQYYSLKFPFIHTIGIVVVRHLLHGKAFLGVCKGLIGSENPYPPSEKALNIPPTVDVQVTNRPTPQLQGNNTDDELDLLTQIINVIRDDIEKIIENDIYQNNVLIHDTNILLSYGNLREAKFVLGFVLSDIRNYAITSQLINEITP